MAVPGITPWTEIGGEALALAVMGEGGGAQPFGVAVYAGTGPAHTVAGPGAGAEQGASRRPSATFRFECWERWKSLPKQMTSPAVQQCGGQRGLRGPDDICFLALNERAQPDCRSLAITLRPIFDVFPDGPRAAANDLALHIHRKVRSSRETPILSVLFGTLLFIEPFILRFIFMPQGFPPFIDGFHVDEQKTCANRVRACAKKRKKKKSAA